MSLSLKELLDWPPEIESLAKATRGAAQNHTNTAEFLQGIAKTSTWQGHGGDAARASVAMNAAHHDAAAQQLVLGAIGMEYTHVEAEALANKIKAILNYADENPAVEVNTSTNQVTPPNTDHLTDEAAAQVAAKTADVQRQLAAALAEGDKVDTDLARAIGVATGLPEQEIELVTHDIPLTLKPGESRNLGPVAGTGADKGIPGIGAADLGEVVQLPNGKYVAIFGDSFSGNKMGEGDHYPSVAVPVKFENGKMVIDGPPLTGPEGKNVLFPPPPQAAGTDTLPAGSIRMSDGTTYMMVSGTNNLNPTGGSWLVKATNDPSSGWQPVKDSWRPWTPNAAPSAANPHPGTAVGSQPTQISGYQAADGKVYIAADSFDRSQGVSMYRVDPDQVTDRNAWQPWTGNGWGHPGQVATPSPGGDTYGELSFRDVEGKPVLSGFNAASGGVDLHVGEVPTSVLDGARTAVAPGGDWTKPMPGTYPQNYGGFILPGSTLNDLGVLVSQWNTGTNTPYVVEQFQVNPSR